MAEPLLRLYPGYEGHHTREEAPGAIPNGSRVRKVYAESADKHPAGALATILGSLYAPGVGYGYFVEWDATPGKAVFVAPFKIAPDPGH